MNKYALAMQIIQSVREKTDTAVLYYSAGGKDGIASVSYTHLLPIFFV